MKTYHGISDQMVLYLPKGTDFSKISDGQIAQIESLLNNRPRKCWGLKHLLKSLPHLLHFEVECGDIKGDKIRNAHSLN